MSLLLDSLRRGRHGAGAEGGSRRGAQADAVLATLGYARENRSGSARRIIGTSVLAVLLFTAGWLGWQWYSGVDGDSIFSDGSHAVPLMPQPAETAPPPAVPSTIAAPDAANASPDSGSAPAANVAVAPSAAKPVRKRAAGTAQTPVTQSHATTPVKSLPPATTSDEFQLALYYQRAGDFDNALIQYRALLQRQPMNAQARNNLGLLYQTKGMLPEAVSEFQRALYIDARYARARNNLGVALLNQGNSDAAAAEFRAVLSQDPRSVDAIVNLALAEKAAGRSERAKETLLRALVIDQRSAPAHYNLGVLFESTGESARAAEHYRAFLEHAGTGYSDRAPEVRARLDTLTRPRQP